MKPTLYGIAEIAAALEARPQTVAQWKFRGQMPQPTALLASGPVWDAKIIEPWISSRRKSQRNQLLRATRKS